MKSEQVNTTRERKRGLDDGKQTEGCEERQKQARTCSNRPSLPETLPPAGEGVSHLYRQGQATREGVPNQTSKNQEFQLFSRLLRGADN